MGLAHGPPGGRCRLRRVSVWPVSRLMLAGSVMIRLTWSLRPSHVRRCARGVWVRVGVGRATARLGGLQCQASPGRPGSGRRPSGWVHARSSPAGCGGWFSVGGPWAVGGEPGVEVGVGCPQRPARHRWLGYVLRTGGRVRVGSSPLVGGGGWFARRSSGVWVGAGTKVGGLRRQASPGRLGPGRRQHGRVHIRSSLAGCGGLSTMRRAEGERVCASGTATPAD